MGGSTLHDNGSIVEGAVVERVLPDIHRVRNSDRVIGYVLHSGGIHVSLLGGVYNTAVEIAQSHDLETAIAHLLAR